MTAKSSPNLIYRTLVVAGLAIAVIIGMVAYQVRHTYVIAVEIHNREIQQLAQILETSTNTTFQSVELIVDHAAEEVLDQEAIPELYNGLADRFLSIANEWDFVYSVSYIDANGDLSDLVIRGDDGALERLEINANFSATNSFTYHSTENAGDNGRIHIGDPVPAHVSSDTVIPVSKAVYDKAGLFRGVCIVTVSLDTFSELYSGLLPETYRSVALYKQDGTRIFRAPAPQADLSASIADRPLFTKWLVESKSGTIRASGAREQIEHLVAYRESQKYPIVITVSVMWSQVLANWESDSYIFAGSAFVGVAFILALILWLVHRIKAEQIAQSELLKSERHLAESQQLGGISHFERNLETGATTWAADMYAAHGVEPSTFTLSRTSFLSLVVPQDRAEAKRSWVTSENPIPFGHVAYRIEVPGGEVRHMRCSWRMIEGDANSPARVFGVAQDVTAMRVAEDTIRDEETRLQDILECSSEYIWETDSDGLLTVFSGEGAVQFGDIIGKRRSIFNFKNTSLSGGDMPKLHDALARKRKFRNLIVPATDASGEVRWARVSGNPRFDRDGRFVGFRGAGNDVTDAKQQRDTEEHRRKVEALGRLAGGLAHEINNLVQPILIYATVGETTPGISKNIQKYFSRIARASEHATLVVKNVLTYARQGQPKCEEFRVLGIVLETVELVEGMLASNVSLTVDQSAVDVPVVVDRTGLAQALTNLITNASESMPEGGQIILRAAEDEISAELGKEIGLSPGSYCRLDVEDGGLGVSADQAAKIFDPFFTTKAQGKGTGLGLSVVSGLAKSWGGVVTVDSKPGAGSRFSIYLPVATLQQHAAQ